MFLSMQKVLHLNAVLKLMVISSNELVGTECSIQVHAELVMSRGCAEISC